MKRPVRKLLIALAVIALLGVMAGWNWRRGNEGAAAFQTAVVTRGDLAVTISATGTVEPEEVVDVGAQVAGQILSFGRDINGHAVDYGSRVTAGTVLARIDDSLYVAELANVQAQVQAAQAGLQRAEADLMQYQAKLQQAERDWRRAEKLGPSEALAQASYDAYHSSYETARANVAVGQAAILQARANLAQTEALLSRAKRNLGYCTITSPVNGVIIDRRVNIGQTVVASLNAPSLFLIAKDLTRMQVWVAVNEADIGKIRPGQAVTFTVDAFPGETFRGTVGKVRLNAAMTQNVVTFTVEIITDNKDGRLLPYLTANVQFELQHMPDVLLVPNAALRWTPQAGQIASRNQDGAPATEGQGPPHRNDGSSPRTGQDGNRPMLWTPEGEYVRAVRVRAVASDGIMTAVLGRGVREGMAVVTGMNDDERESGGTRNPFAPPRRGHGRPF